MKISPHMRKSAYTDCSVIADAVWPTKLHRPLLATPEIKALLEARLRAVAHDNGSSIVHLDIAEDNVRVRLTAPPDLALLALIHKMKTDSAKHLRAAFPDLKTKISGLWSWHLYLRGVGNPSVDDADEYLLQARGLGIQPKVIRRRPRRREPVPEYMSDQDRATFKDDMTALLFSSHVPPPAPPAKKQKGKGRRNG